MAMSRLVAEDPMCLRLKCLETMLSGEFRDPKLELLVTLFEAGCSYI